MSLADAIINEDIPQIYAMLRYGQDLNQLDEYGFTPLIEAAIVDNVEISELLISHGADANFQDSTGGTALHWAAENNNHKLAKLLLINGADPNAYNLAGQPVMVMPYLRQQQSLKKLLITAGANLSFTQDYINTKFLGHLFELVGTANIISPRNEFVEVDFEGFYLEVTLGMIAESFFQFKAHFAGRKIRRYTHLGETIVNILNRAAELIKYQQYRLDIKKYDPQIITLIRQEPLIVPIGYEGHAITFIKYGNILVKCDRREDSRLYDNVMFYHMKKPELFSEEFIKNIIYEKQSSEFINDYLPQYLALEPITEIKVSAQISGNCSWANVEACIPVLFFLLFSHAEDFEKNISSYKSIALDFYHQWREWNKDRSLNFCIQSFKESDSIRKACKAELLIAILYQCCGEQTAKNQERIDSIMSVLRDSRYQYVIQNYIKTYCYEDQSEEGKNFMQILKLYDAI